MSESVPTSHAWVLSGEAGEPSEFTLPSGLHVVARTDKGIGYDKPTNEDRVVIGYNEELDLVSVIDGMGGQGNGALAADIIAHTLREGIATVTQRNVHQRLEELLRLARQRILDAFDEDNQFAAQQTGAAVQVLALYNGELGRMACGLHAGDIRRIYVPRAGRVQESTDHANRRGELTKAVTGRKYDAENVVLPLGPGGTLMLGSDGVLPRNISVADVVALCRLPIQQILAEVWRITGEKMTSTLPGNIKIYGAKPDNRSFLVVDIPEPPEAAEAPTAEDGNELPDFALDE